MTFDKAVAKCQILSLINSILENPQIPLEDIEDNINAILTQSQFDEFDLIIRQQESEALERVLIIKYLYKDCSDEDLLNAVEWVIGKNVTATEN